MTVFQPSKPPTPPMMPNPPPQMPAASNVIVVDTGKLKDLNTVPNKGNSCYHKYKFGSSMCWGKIIISAMFKFLIYPGIYHNYTNS